MSGGSKWDRKYLYIGLTAFFVIGASILLFTFLNNWSGVKRVLAVILRALSPIIWGCVIAYLLNTPMKLLERYVFARLAARLCPKGSELKRRRVARVISAAIVILLALGAVGGILALVLPQVIESVKSIVPNIQTYADELMDLASRFFDDNPEVLSYADSLIGNVGEYIRQWAHVHIIQRADLIIANITGGIYNVVRGVIDVVIGLVVSFYLIYHKETFGAQGKKIIYSLFRPDRANTVLQGVRFVDRTCGGFISGKILDSLIVGVICYISMLILKMPYPALIAVVVGVTNVIPFFGPFIGAVPCALILIFISPHKCLIFIVYIIVLQQIDGNIIGPRILGNTTGLSGFWILFALLFFGSLFGFWGMMLGVPVFSVIYAVVKRLISKKLRKRELPVDTQAYEKLERVDEQTNQAVSRTAEQESAVPRFVRRRRSRKKAPEEKQDDET